MENEDTPKIYVASLTDYNSGRLVGKWIDCEGLDADDITTEVKEMLDAATKNHPEDGIREEWAIHDYECFAPFELGEWETFERVAELAEIVSHPRFDAETFQAYLDAVGFDADPVGFDIAYCGTYDCVQSFVEDWYPEECKAIENIQMFGNSVPVNWDSMVLSAQCNEGIYITEISDGVAVFEPARYHQEMEK